MDKDFQIVESSTIPNPTAFFQEQKMFSMLKNEPPLGLHVKLDWPLPGESEKLEYETLHSTSSDVLMTDIQETQFPAISSDIEVLDLHGDNPSVSLFACADVNVNRGGNVLFTEHGTFYSTSSDTQEAQFPETSLENEDHLGGYPFVSLFACADVNYKVENKNLSAAEICQPLVDMAVLTQRFQLILENKARRKEKEENERLQSKSQSDLTPLYKKITESNLSLLAGYGINYEDCLTPMQVLAKKDSKNGKRKVARMFQFLPGITPVWQEEKEQNVYSMNEMIGLGALAGYGIYEDCLTPMEVIAKEEHRIANMLQFMPGIVPVRQEEKEQDVYNMYEMMDLDAQAATSNENCSVDKSVKGSDLRKELKLDYLNFTQMIAPDKNPTLIKFTAKRRKLDHSVGECKAAKVPDHQISLSPIQGIAKNDHLS